MQIALVVGLSLLLAIAIAASVFCYSYYIYSKNTLFTKTKTSVLMVVLCAFLIVCFSAIITLFSVDLAVWHKSVNFDPTYIGLASVLLVASIIYLVAMLLVPKVTNKNKIAYDNMLNVDWNAKLDELNKRVGDMEIIKNKLAKSNKKYYTSMLEFYENILKNLKDEKISLSQKLADIATFNEAFSHKWSSFLNNFQLSLTYKYLALFQKVDGKK